MAFSAFGQTSGPVFGAASSGSATGSSVQTGPDLEEIQTEGLGFQTLAGEAKVKLLPSPWPADGLPPPTSSLLSIASNKGLLAAGGLDSVIVATTESVREAFTSTSNGASDLKTFTPQLTLPIGTRISQVAFSSDESVLVLSAEKGGGLAVYDVQSLLQGNTQSAFELATNGIAVRALLPNPALAQADNFALIMENGDLMMANMKTRQFLSGAQGQVLQAGVSAVAWSNKGKQLVAGLATGRAVQMTPEGQIKAEIPSPPSLGANHYVSAIAWLENDLFLLAHTPSNDDNSLAPVTSYHLVSRQQNSYSFQKLPEVCGPWGLNRSPPIQFLQRLRDFEPDLRDMIIVASTASQDVGLFIRAKAPLTSTVPAEKCVNVFTTTTMATDSRRAQLPMTEDLTGDTSPLGMALDLSAKAKVPKPLPGEEMEESSTPLPALMILNNEGVLVAWWIVYADSVRKGTHYSGLMASASLPPSTSALTTGPQSSPFAATSSAGTTASPFAAPKFSAPAFGTPSAPGNGSTPAFGAPSEMSGNPATAFGAASALGGSSSTAFGATSSMGSSQSPWASKALTGGSGATNQPAFGGPSSPGRTGASPAFGSVGGMGLRNSPWSTGKSTSGPSGVAFGQTSGLGSQSASFGSPSASASDTAVAPAAPAMGQGFASFANTGGFTAAASMSSGDNASKQTSNNTPSVSFGSTMDVGSSFGASPAKSGGDSSSLFGAKPDVKPSPFGQQAKPSASIFGQPSAATATPFGQPSAPDNSIFGASTGTNPLTLGNKPANADTSDTPKNKPNSNVTFGGGSFFGDTFGNALNEVSKPAEPSAASSAPADNPQAKSSENPFSRNGPPNAIGNTAPPAASGQFGTVAQASETPAAVQTSAPAPDLGPSPIKIKKEPGSSEASTPAISTPPGNPPVPPDTTSKTSYTPGSSSASSASAPTKAFTPEKPFSAPSPKSGAQGRSSDAPLPPDFLSARPSRHASTPPLDDAPLPPDFTNTRAQQPKAAEAAPLPPDFVPKRPAVPEPDHSPQSEGLPDDDEESLEDEEGSGVDVAQELSPSEQSSKFTPDGSFTKTDKSPSGGIFSSTNPATQAPPLFSSKDPSTQAPSKSLFGELGNPLGKASIPRFPPPSRDQQSPRSPSPMRNAAPGQILRPDSSRSLNATGIAGNTAIDSRSNSSRGAQVTPSSFVLPPPTQPPIEPEQSLSDDEDQRVRAELEKPIEPDLNLAPFIAHQDYVGSVTTSGIPGQIEKVYRDINSMIDTLGLNSRSLQSFLQAHMEECEDSARARDDLEPDAQTWCLPEAQSLIALCHDYKAELAEERINDVREKLQTCRSLQEDAGKARARQTDAKSTLEAHTEPSLRASVEAAPLSAEQSIIRFDLRKKFADFQRHLTALEEGVALVQAKLVATGHANTGAKANGEANSSSASAKMPTVEAVERTIAKMTAMAERKSGDIDVLEAQLKRMGLFSPARPSSVASSRSSLSRDGSPFVTPPTSRRPARGVYRGPHSSPTTRFKPATTLQGTNLHDSPSRAADGSAAFTPASSTNGTGAYFHTPRSSRALFASSVGSVSTANSSSLGLQGPMRLNEVDGTSRDRYAMRAARRQQMNGLLRDALLKTDEVVVRPLNS